MIMSQPGLQSKAPSQNQSTISQSIKKWGRMKRKRSATAMEVDMTSVGAAVGHWSLSIGARHVLVEAHISCLGHG